MAALFLRLLLSLSFTSILSTPLSPLSLARAGKYEEALDAYADGAAELEIAEMSRPLLSKRFEHTIDALLTDLRSNAAAAALKMEDYSTVLNTCDKVLENNSFHAKCLYRRAKAYAAIGEEEAAKRDLKRLIKKQPDNVAARKLLETLPKPVLGCDNEPSPCVVKMTPDQLPEGLPYSQRSEVKEESPKVPEGFKPGDPVPEGFVAVPSITKGISGVEV